ncbi:MATE family efflux transporter [Tepidibacter hydrothermalis]|uniref:Multidrug export protein MepA n=1 Tax=Tepidibacter hydrothermalis TaxID=3036126 RepID=A0ABY8E7H0_9FIRM|nr:MATE family efflux transporter [Tepidibacter hydrothermalis]WFD08856.1 MATE family efflux transporter [Tepidibacter hydrothermalis]
MDYLFSKKFTFKEFLKFVAPAVISMVFISLYTIIDGIFVSNLAGPDALASINIVLPIFNIVLGFSIMLGAGGSALISKMLGEKNNEKANEALSLIVYSGIIIGIILAIVGIIFSSNIFNFLGATDILLPYCISYGNVIILCTPIFIVKTMFEFFVRADGDFNFSLFLSIIGGVVNIVFDYVFIKLFNLGILGAALATGLGILVSCLFGFWYFFSSKSNLNFVIPKFNLKLLKDTMYNGSSEMVSELSTGITTFLFNILALKYAGERGVAALSIILYIHFLLVSTYLGFSSGIAPLISFNYGAKNTDKLKETFKYSKTFILVSSLLIFTTSLLFAPFLVRVFVSTDSQIYNLTLFGLRIFSFSFLFVGLNIFTSALFTAFSNGKISSITSFSRTFAFVLLGAYLFPPLFKINGLWLIVPFAEIATMFISVIFIKKYKNFYMY